MERPAFYAARPGGWRDWWTVLHPPYTAWHLSYVVIGATIAPHVHVSRLVGPALAFFLAGGTVGGVGVVRVGVVLVPFIVVGPLLVMAYNAELFGGVVHTDAGFAAAWG